MFQNVHAAYIVLQIYVDSNKLYVSKICNTDEQNIQSNKAIRKNVVGCQCSLVLVASWRFNSTSIAGDIWLRSVSRRRAVVVSHWRQRGRMEWSGVIDVVVNSAVE